MFTSGGVHKWIVHEITFPKRIRVAYTEDKARLKSVKMLYETIPHCNQPFLFEMVQWAKWFVHVHPNSGTRPGYATDPLASARHQSLVQHVIK